MSVLNMVGLELAGKRVLIREDLNVPIEAGRITSDKRIRASLPTIRHAMEAGAKVILMSHRGRPVEGDPVGELTLQPIADHLAALLGCQVELLDGYLDGIRELADGEVVLLENCRCNVGEKRNSDDLSKKYAALCDIYVNDAFGTAHRAQASTYGVGMFAPIACAGPLLANELEALGRALDKPARPMVAIIGGSKVSTKLTVMEALSQVVDQLIPGGGIANTFIAASGYSVGKSLYEEDLIPEAQRLMAAARERGGEIPVPTDVVVGKEFSAESEAVVKKVSEVASEEMIFDIGPETAARFAAMLEQAGTVVWNGPVGVFEFDQFGVGTRVLGEAIADSKAFSIAGGGDTLAAVDKYNIAERVSYISTGGGAFLEFLEGKKLPAVEMLERSAQRH